MRISNWMKHPVHTVRPLDTLVQAREVMERYRVNQLPVVVDGRLRGIVTDRDLRDAFPSALEHGRRRTRSPHSDPAAVPVEDIMTANVLTLGPTDLVADAARVMRRERVGALPIIDGTRLVGILTRSDVLDAFAALAAPAATARAG